VAYGGFVRGWTQLTGLALFAFGARELGVSDFGVFALAMVFINLVQTFLFSGLYEFVLRSRPEEGVDHTALVLNVLISILGAALSSGMGWLIARGTHQPAVFHLVVAMAPSSLIAGVQAWHEAQLLREKDYRTYYLNWGVGETIAAGCGLALLASGAGLYSLVGYRYLQTVLMLGGYIVFAPVPYFGPVHLGKTREIMRFAGPIYGSRTLGSLSYYGIDLVIGLLLGPAATGIYRMANRVVASATEAIFQPLRVLTWISASREGGDAKKIAQSFVPIIRAGTFLLWPASVILSYAAADALRLGLGDKWQPAAPVIATLFLGRCLFIAEIFLEPLLASTGGGRLLLLTRCTSIAVMVGALLVLSPLGVAYVGLANIAAALIICAVIAPTLIRNLGVGQLMQAVRLAAITTLCVLVVIALGKLALVLHPWPPLAVHIVVAAAASALLLAVLIRNRDAVLALRR
jgi:O-antigen/teichoic acid export membrane protein